MVGLEDISQSLSLNLSLESTVASPSINLFFIRGETGQPRNKPQNTDTPLMHNMDLTIFLYFAETECAKITNGLLKSRTGEFDLESILFLKLRSLGRFHPAVVVVNMTYM